MPLDFLSGVQTLTRKTIVDHWFLCLSSNQKKKNLETMKQKKVWSGKVNLKAVIIWLFLISIPFCMYNSKFYWLGVIFKVCDKLVFPASLEGFGNRGRQAFTDNHPCSFRGTSSQNSELAPVTEAESRHLKAEEQSLAAGSEIHLAVL